LALLLAPFVPGEVPSLLLSWANLAVVVLVVVFAIYPWVCLA